MRPRMRLAPSLLVAAFALHPFVPALAGIDEPSTPGSLHVKQNGGVVVEMPLRHTSVAIEVTAFVARTNIEQTFANPFDHPVEAVYTFPLGDRAAVDDFELVVGERVIRGEIRRREEARQVYEDARASGYQAALLEQERPNIFTQSVANLEPGREIKVRIRTVETLRYEKGVYGLTFPLVVGPRYIPGGRAALDAMTASRVPPTGRVPDAPCVTPPVLTPGLRSGHDVDISVTVDAGVPIVTLESPSHRVLVDRPAAGRARVRLAADDTIPNKDFLLRWSVSSEKPALGFLAHRDGLDGFFTLLVQPKGEVSVQEAAPKEIILAVDTSGSMSGIPIEASKRFIRKALHELGPRDTFNLIRFAGDDELYSENSRPNTPAEVARAISWLDELDGRGGTEMLKAFRTAFAQPPDPNRLRIVIFLTDGEIGNEHEILAEIGAVLGAARIHTVGIGSSVNHYLLDRMADLGHGAYIFIRPDERADEAIESFRSWVTKPYLTDLAIDWGALPLADVNPERLRELCSGQTLTVVGRYLRGGEGDVVVRGKLGGSYWEQKLHVVLPEREERHAALASLWARTRVEELLLATSGVVPDSVRAEVTSLALEYRLMSPFTSFVAVDESRVVNPGGKAPTVHQALPVPDGVSFEGVFGSAGPEALQAGADSTPEDHMSPEEIETPMQERVLVNAARAAGYKTVATSAPGGVVGGVVGGVEGGVPGGLSGEPLAVAFGRAQGGYASVASLSSPRDNEALRNDLPVRGRFHQNILTLAPGASGTDGDGDPTVRGSRDRDFKVLVRRSEEVSPVAELMASARLRETALRVLADLADDGKLGASEGKPALAALLAAERPSGAISEDVSVHALATWALAEAAAKMDRDPWVTQASAKAVGYLVSLAGPNGWPARPGGAADAEATRWARLALKKLRPETVAAVPAPKGEASLAYMQLRNAIVGARMGARQEIPPGLSPFDRLLTAIGRGHLTITL